MMNRRKVFWTMIKIAMILFLCMVIYALFSLLLQTILEPIQNDDKAWHLRHYEELTAEDNYGDLYDELILFDHHEEIYDDFWKAAKAYHIYCQYTAASQAVQKTDNPQFAAVCKKQAEEAFQALQNFPEDVANPTVQAAIRRIKEKLYGI